MKETTKTPDKTKAKRIFVLLLIFLIALLGVFLYGQQRKAQKEIQEPSQTQPQGPTKEEVLEGLSAPSGGPPPTEEKKQEILEGLSAPASPQSKPPTEEEKRAILEALSKPAQ